MSKVRIVYNRLLQGWYVIRGPHQTPISGRFDSKADAQAYLDRHKPQSMQAQVKLRFENEGHQAFMFGTPLDSNPYKFRSAAWACWRNGWLFHQDVR